MRWTAAAVLIPISFAISRSFFPDARASATARHIGKAAAFRRA
jgi:hypothetical protein